MVHINVDGGTNAGWKKTRAARKTPWKCHKCGAVNEMYWINCPKCGASRD